MRVALFPSAFHPSLGGVEELTGRLALDLRQLGVKSLIVTNRWPRDLPTAEIWNGIPLRRIPFRLPEGGLRAWTSFTVTGRRLLGSLEETMRAFRPDVVHVQCVSSNSWYAAKVAEQLEVPLLVTAQGERFMDAQGLYKRSAISNRLLRHALDKAQWVTACSQSTVLDLENYYGSTLKHRSAVIYNGASPEAFGPFSKWAHPNPYLFAVGRLVPQKGFSQLLRAFAKAGNLNHDLLLAGDGPESGELHRLSKSIGLEERVHFLGKITHKDVASLMHSSRGVVVPSLREPLGMVTLEAMAAGRPLLASRVGGIPEVAPEQPGVRLITPGCENELISGIHWLTNQEPEKVEAALQQHAYRFSSESIAREYLQIYKQIQAN